MTKVLMVCLGNICRSPLAEGILQSKVDDESVLVDSAGTGGYHVGSAPDERSIAVAKKYDLDISQQKCRKFTKEDFDEFDIIYVMDRSNYSNVIDLANNESQKNKVKLILEELGCHGKEVPDPYYGGINGFEHVYQLLDGVCDKIAEKLVTNGND